MKRFAGLVLVLCLLLAVFAAPVGAAADDKIVLKFAHHYPTDHPHTVAAEYFKKIVEERTDGAIEVQLYPNNQMGNSHQLFESLMLGSVDIILTDPGAPAFADVPLWDIVMGPFMYRDYDHAYTVAHSQLMQDMYDDLEATLNITVIDPVWYYGVRHLTTADTPVYTPDDLKGLKIRTPEIPGFIKAIEVIGGIPTPLSFADLYLALKQGVVDGQENPVGVIYANKYYEAQNYLIKTGHIISKNTVYMSTAVLNGLSPEYQEIILTAIDEAGRYNDELIYANEEEMQQKLIDLGMTVIEPEEGVFRDKAMEGLMEWFNEDQLEFFNAIQEM